jgi:Lrp/AsnC family transcriptional regulator, leucine-responsive regulatory protein
MRDDNVIVGDVSIISPDAVGRQLTMIVQVALVREQPDLIDAFKRSMRNTPEVVQCYYTRVTPEPEIPGVR